MNKKRAVSLVEIMVVAGIGAFFLGVVYMFWGKSMFFINRGNVFLIMQRGARMALELLEDDIEQCVYFTSGDEHFFVKTDTDKMELYRYSTEFEKDGRPKLQKIIYTREKDGNTFRIYRTVTEDSKIISRKKYGEYFTELKFEPYILELGPAGMLTKDRYFIRVHIKAEYEAYKHPEQQLEVITSFGLKTPNNQFKDRYYLHNPVSQRDLPSN